MSFKNTLTVSKCVLICHTGLLQSVGLFIPIHCLYVHVLTQGQVVLLKMLMQQ